MCSADKSEAAISPAVNQSALISSPVRVQWSEMMTEAVDDIHHATSDVLPRKARTVEGQDLIEARRGARKSSFDVIEILSLIQGNCGYQQNLYLEDNEIMRGLRKNTWCALSACGRSPTTLDIDVVDEPHDLNCEPDRG
jgi:hypothetical protein